MQFAGQLFAHLPQPTQLSASTSAKHPFLTLITFFGQTSSQVPQATQIESFTFAYLFDAILDLPIHLISAVTAQNHKQLLLFYKSMSPLHSISISYSKASHINTK